MSRQSAIQRNLKSEAYRPKWFYRSCGEVVGPVSAFHLKVLIESGEVAARQAVWMEVECGRLFVNAAAAALQVDDVTHYAQRYQPTLIHSA